MNGDALVKSTTKIMFGDAGHGLILLVITLYLFYLANKGKRSNRNIKVCTQGKCK